MSAFDFGRMNWSLAGDDGSFSESACFVLGGIFLPAMSRLRHELVSPTSPIRVMTNYGIRTWHLLRAQMEGALPQSG